MDSLPDDILFIIFQWAYKYFSSRNFLSCLTVCRHWCDLAVPILYHDVVLHNRDIPFFAAAISLSNASFVRSLTINVEAEVPTHHIDYNTDPIAYEQNMEFMNVNGSEETQRLWHQLQQLGSVLAGMTHLTTFSLRVISAGAPGFWLPRPLIAAFIARLSKSCVNLEIDTQGFDFLGPGYGHLCEGVQALLPRLQHLRLRVAAMCCRIFGDGFTAHGTIEDESELKHITAPVLRTVVINCDNHSAYGSHSHVCDTFSEMPYSMCRGAVQSRIALATCLRLLVSRSAFAKCHKICLIDMQLPDNEDRTVFAAYNQRDVLNNVTHSLPFRCIDPHRSRTYMARLPGDVEILGPSWAIVVVGEGRSWVTSNGSRFPAEVRGAKRADNIRPYHYPLPLEDRRAFHRRSKVWILLWKWEDELGQTLLRATHRKGLIDSTPIKLELPAGWRISEEDGTTVLMSET